MDEAAAHPMRLSDEDALRDRVAELAADLRAAAMKGDTLRITRLLDVARRDLRPAYLVYIDLNNLKEVNDSAGHAAGDELIRQTGNFLRELFPSYESVRCSDGSAVTSSPP